MRGIATGSEATVTQNAAFKRAVRARMVLTGQTYQQARRALLAEREPALAAAPLAPRPPAHGGRVVGTVTMHNSSLVDLDRALATFGPPVELLTAFCGEDLVFKAGLSPAQFAPDGMVVLPNCLLVNARSEWLGVQGPNCGYSGTGPINTVRLLEYLGADPRATEERVRADRYLRVDLGTGEIIDRSTNPVSHVSFDRQDVAGGLTIVRLPRPRSRIDPEMLQPRERTGFDAYRYEREGGGNTVKHWCDEVLRATDPPAWAMGPARARCYLTREAVRAAGLDAKPAGWTMFMPTVVLEQGELQLWCEAEFADRGALLSADAERILELVGLPVPRETRLQRMMRLARGGHDYIDVSADGAGLRHDPAVLMDEQEWRDARRIAAMSFPHPPSAAVSRRPPLAG